MYVYEACCTDLADRLAAHREMIDKAVPVSYRTMHRRCVGLTKWAREHGYGRDLPLAKDWHVGYFRSVFEGRPCYYLVWSAYEFIWTS